MKNFSIQALVVIVLTHFTQAVCAADPTEGKRVFNKCKACHALTAGKNKVGPTLYGIIGRKAASVANFKYSTAMKRADLTWNDETLRSYLKKPRAFLKGTRMAFAGIKKQKDMDNLIAYLKEATK